MRSKNNKEVELVPEEEMMEDQEKLFDDEIDSLELD